jgi:AraC-type DNA-binding domain-containing proteins
MDPLSEVLSLLRPRSYTVGGFDHGGAFCIRFPLYQGVKCYILVSGELWLRVDGETSTLRLCEGDCVVLAKGRSFCISSNLEEPEAEASLFQEHEFKNGEIRILNGGGSCFILAGHFYLDGPGIDILTGLLPSVIHLHSEADKASLRWYLECLMQELRFPQPGGGLITQQLAYSILVQSLRLYLKGNGGHKAGWLFALGDQPLGQVLQALHENPAQSWTLSEMANMAGMSRSNFAQKFKAKVGMPAMEYLTQWRMLRAADLLSTTKLPVGEIGYSVGYESESAFSAAFKRRMGYSPLQYAQKIKVQPHPILAISS